MTTAGAEVSIPFKRESVFRVVGLQGTGYRTYSRSFNSLQTGKCIQSFEIEFDGSVIGVVSIPFKRESVFRVSQC